MSFSNTCKLTVWFSANRFDHHQPTFSSTLSSIFPKKTFGTIKLSSAGLVYAHFGHQIISQLMEWPKDDPQTDKLFDMVYDQFIKEIDAIDNGKFKETFINSFYLNICLVYCRSQHV